MDSSRRAILTALMAGPSAALLASRGHAANSPDLLPTPACGEPEDATPSQTAGPYYKPASPKRRKLRATGASAESIELGGRVLDTHCQPLGNVLVEIWHADETGGYDTRGFKWRGHQFTAADGHWGFETILVPPYLNRTAHYHFRIQPPNGRPLITQLYFPNHPRNARDRIFNSRLQLTMGKHETRHLGHFDFVLAT